MRILGDKKTQLKFLSQTLLSIFYFILFLVMDYVANANLVGEFVRITGHESLIITFNGFIIAIISFFLIPFFIIVFDRFKCLFETIAKLQSVFRVILIVLTYPFEYTGLKIFLIFVYGLGGLKVFQDSQFSNLFTFLIIFAATFLNNKLVRDTSREGLWNGVLQRGFNRLISYFIIIFIIFSLLFVLITLKILK